MLSFAEMLGRLAVNDRDTYPAERLEAYEARIDERVVEPTDLLVPDVRPRAVRVLHAPVGGEQADPCRTVVDVGSCR